MAKKKEHAQVLAKLSDAKWINTPFAFVNFGKRFTLLQQHIMLMVSDSLQSYISKFYNEKRDQSGERPLSLFTKDLLTNGVPLIQIKLNELGVDANHYEYIDEAITAIQSLTVKAPVYDEKGMVKEEKRFPVFSEVTIPVTGKGYNVKIGTSAAINFDRSKGYIEVEINKNVAAYAFDMRMGYVNHPLNIARDSQQTYAPPLYFLVKHALIRGKKTVTIPFMNLKESLGMIERDPETGAVSKVIYPKFSQFKQRVLESAIADIARMAQLNQIDVKINYKPIYKGVERGDPEAINFTVELSDLGKYHKNPDSMKEETTIEEKPQETNNDMDLFSENLPGDKVQEWGELLTIINDDKLLERIGKSQYYGTSNGNPLIVFPDYKSRLDYEEYLYAAGKETLRSTINKEIMRLFPKSTGKIMTQVGRN